MAGPSSDLFRSIELDLKAVEERLAEIGSQADETLRGLLDPVLLSPGKRLRPALTVACCKLFRSPNRTVYSMTAAVECLHAATLVHDDVVDQSEERRGRPALYTTAGNALALLTGDYLFAQAAAIASETNNLRIMRLFAECVATMCGGQIEEHARGDASPWLTPEGYYRTIDAKTAALFVLACQTGAILGEAPLGAVGALREYGRAIGLAFQIVDDILDLIGDEGLLGKPAGSDLRQGVVTLPLIYLRDELPETTLRAAFGRDGAREEAIQEITRLARSSRAIHRSYQEAQRHAESGARLLQEVPDGECRDLLMSLAGSVVDRQA